MLLALGKATVSSSVGAQCSKHREALKLRRKKHRGKEQLQPLQPAAMQPRAGDDIEQYLPPPTAQAHAVGGELVMSC